MRVFYIPSIMFIHSMNIYQVLLYFPVLCAPNTHHLINLHNKPLCKVSYPYLTDVKTEAWGIKHLAPDHTGCETGFQPSPVQGFHVRVRAQVTCYQDLYYYDELGSHTYLLKNNSCGRDLDLTTD